MRSALSPSAFFCDEPEIRNSKLRAELERHNHLYYAGEPEISDFDFDQMLRRLQELEAKHPEFSDPNSPSPRVGGEPVYAASPGRPCAR